jgi:hypothetical protein
MAASESAASWFIEKTPLHALHLRLIAAVYPDAWIISIHRDGRDVARSVLDVDFGLDELAGVARAWAAITAEVEQFGASNPRFRDVRYEDLLAGPTALTTELLTWLGLAPDSDVERAVAQRASERVSQYNSSGDVGAGKWKELSGADLRTIYRHAGDRLVAAGYMTPGELAIERSRPRYRFDLMRSVIVSFLTRRKTVTQGEWR